MKRTIAIIIFTCLISQGFSQGTLQLIPYPNEVTLGKGVFLLSPSASIVSEDSSLFREVQFFNAYLKTLAGFELRVKSRVPASIKAVRLSIDKGLAKKAGFYEMEVSSIGVNIKAADATGIFYGLNNLLQIMTKPSGIGFTAMSIPVVTISDAPRFQHRGMMLDVSRHFRSKEAIKKILDLMALHKLNSFHWHLTDDQGWRIEVKKYPLLTQVGAWRNGTIIGHYPGTGNDNIKHGGFYSQEDVKEIVAYAAERHIQVIPEIEMPGHSSAAIAAYPWLSCFPEEETNLKAHPSDASKLIKGKKVQETFGVFEDVFAPTEKTFTFLQDVIDEILPLFPGKYIHIGGDECPKASWKRSEFCQNLIKEKGLKDEEGLQSYFIQRMEKYINSKGRQIIGWDEILEGGLAPNATVMSWRGEAGGIEAAKQKHEVIMSPTSYAYLDYGQSKKEDSLVIGGYLPLEKTYAYDPLPEELENKPESAFILGAQGNVWTEYMDSDSKLEYMIFPRLAALSESFWTGLQHKDFQSFKNRLPGYFQFLKKLNVQYSKSFFELQSAVIEFKESNGVAWTLSTEEPNAQIYFKGPEDKSFNLYEKPIPFKKSGIYAAEKRINGKTVETAEQTFRNHLAVGGSVGFSIPPSKNYPGNGGATGIVNGIEGSEDPKSKEWFGWQGKDVEIKMDLGNQKDIQQLVIHVLNAPNSWIYTPGSVTISISMDGSTYKELSTTSFIGEKEGKIAIPIAFEKKIQARYVSVFIKNYGTIQADMPGAGNKGWTFIDEIVVE